MGKPFWLSRTMWLNVVSAILLFTAELKPILDSFSLLGFSDVTTAQMQTVVAIVNLIGNMLMRTITTEPVKLK